METRKKKPAGITKADIEAAERVIRLATESCELGVCFGMTAKTVRVFGKLLDAVKRVNAEGGAE